MDNLASVLIIAIFVMDFVGFFIAVGVIKDLNRRIKKQDQARDSRFVINKKKKDREEKEEKERQEKIKDGRIEKKYISFVEENFQAWIINIERFKSEKGVQVISEQRNTATSYNKVNVAPEGQPSKYEMKKVIDYACLIEFWYELSEKEYAEKLERNRIEMEAILKKEQENGALKKA